MVQKILSVRKFPFGVVTPSRRKVIKWISLLPGFYQRRQVNLLMSGNQPRAKLNQYRSLKDFGSN
ncbi:MAG: hypothetical protein EOM80_16445 [Erysipelotrichia bacterium]|nr:hypothetical protein [Erysipelotrichia bacterium]